LGALGSTNLWVSRLGLGLAALGRPGYINLGRDVDLGADRSIATMERRCHEVLDAARSAGLRYVDAARSYGLAEQFLASWLRDRNVAPGEITVGSKWGYTYTAGWRVDAPHHEVKELSLATLRRQLRESRDVLGTHLRLYQVHSATLESGVFDDERLLAELGRLRSEGLAVGLTVTGPRQAEVIRRALDVRVEGVNPFQTLQATWNLLEVSAGTALADAKAAGFGVIVKEALANGRLTDRSVIPEGSALRAAAVRLGIPLDAVALAAAMAQPWADVVLSGAATTDQLASNLAALATELPPVGLPAVALAPDAYWTMRSALKWG
jgi:aryl-alcohol dehydrogenase-like predicted oxidoreductase